MRTGRIFTTITITVLLLTSLTDRCVALLFRHAKPTLEDAQTAMETCLRDCAMNYNACRPVSTQTVDELKQRECVDKYSTCWRACDLSHRKNRRRQTSPYSGLLSL